VKAFNKVSPVSVLAAAGTPMWPGAESLAIGPFHLGELNRGSQPREPLDGKNKLMGLVLFMRYFLSERWVSISTEGTLC
jgi:hypothetical protein